MPFLHRLSAALGLVVLTLTVGARADAAELKQSRAALVCGPMQTVIERAMCADATLLELANEIDKLSAQLKSELAPADVTVLADTDMPFVRARNACQNQEATGDALDRRVAECVRQVLTGRAETLRAALQRPGAIRMAIGQFPWIDGAFLNRYADSLGGGRVQVWGCLVLVPASRAADRTRAVIHESSQLAKTVNSVPVQFKSMSDRDATLLDKGPCAFWAGTVQSGGSERFLYVEEILGAALK